MIFQSYLKLKKKQDFTKPRKTFLPLCIIYAKVFVANIYRPKCWTLRLVIKRLCSPDLLLTLPLSSPQRPPPFHPLTQRRPSALASHTHKHTPMGLRHGFAAAAQWAQLCEVVYIFFININSFIIDNNNYNNSNITLL